jgi:hypothetical protein
MPLYKTGDAANAVKVAEAAGLDAGRGKMHMLAYDIPLPACAQPDREQTTSGLF